MLGGSAVHFALAASFFTDVRVVGPVGDDFGDEELEVLADARRRHRRHRARRGRQDVLLARPLRVRPERRPHRRHPAQRVRRLRAEALARPREAAEMLFLGNIQPDLQRQVRAQCDGASFAALDSMNLWIDTARDSLRRRDRARSTACCSTTPSCGCSPSEPNLARAARAVMEMGPRVVVAKQGEYGAALFTGDGFFALPGYPLEDVRDPTGAGDSFAGGFLGYLDARRRRAPPTTTRCAGRWPTARCWPRSTSRSSAPSGSQRLTHGEIDRALRGVQADDALRRRCRSNCASSASREAAGSSR